MSSQQHTGAIKKQPNMRKSILTPKELKPVCGMAIPSHIEMKPENAKHDKRYMKPQLNSILKMKDEIENIMALKAPPLENTADLTPRSKSTIIPMLNRKLNFDANRPVFKNLVRININDSLLLKDNKETTSIRKKYNMKFSQKPPAPDLSDFLDPIPPQTHVVPVPKITLEFPEYKRDLLAAYKRFADV